MNPYETLGVEKDADEDTIKKAYRGKAKAHHPDAGGEREEFEKVSRAYMVLSNPKARQRYDETGEIKTDKLNDDQQRAWAIISQFLESLVEAETFTFQTDAVAMFRDMTKDITAKFTHERTQCTRKIEKTEQLLKRFKRKTEGYDLIEDVYKRRIGLLKRQIEAVDDKLRWHALALDIMNAYEFTFDKPQPFNPYITTPRPGASFFGWNT